MATAPASAMRVSRMRNRSLLPAFAELALSPAMLRMS